MNCYLSFASNVRSSFMMVSSVGFIRVNNMTESLPPARPVAANKNDLLDVDQLMLRDPSISTTRSLAEMDLNVTPVRNRGRSGVSAADKGCQVDMRQAVSSLVSSARRVKPLSITLGLIVLPASNASNSLSPRRSSRRARLSLGCGPASTAQLVNLRTGHSPGPL
jgi:hypothetical protein